MKPEEIAAYIGAAAWLPQIVTWVYRTITKPTVTVVPDKNAEVGFTSYGPIFNLRMMLSTENKGLIIDGFELILRHSDGDAHTLRWSGLLETFSEITDNAGNRQVVSRDQTPIALKIGTESLTEKFIRFQEPRFHETDRPATLELVAHFNFLKQSSPNEYVEQTLSSKELFSVLENRKKAFWWKPGGYEIEAKLSSTVKFKIINPKFYFDLTSIDIERLKQNIPTIDSDLKNIIQSNIQDFKASPINWNWANVDIQKLRSAGKQVP